MDEELIRDKIQENEKRDDHFEKQMENWFTGVYPGKHSKKI